jgi:hypothetical protein
MSYQDPLKTEERELEAQLRRLPPAAHHLQRDTLMFQAGHRAARRQLRLWQAVASVLLLGVILLGTPSQDRRADAEFPTLARVEPPSDSELPRSTGIGSSWVASPASGAASEYLRLRHRLVMEGGDALPVLQACPSGPNATETLADWYRAMARGSTRAGRILTPNLQTHGDRS